MQDPSPAISPGGGSCFHAVGSISTCRWVTKCAFPALLAYTTQLASRLQNATLKMTNQIDELKL
jgi:hypothetical protein